METRIVYQRVVSTTIYGSIKIERKNQIWDILLKTELEKNPNSVINDVIKYKKNNFLIHHFRIPNNVRRLVIQTIVKYGTENDWFFLLERAKNLPINAEKMLILRSLTTSNDFNLLKMYIFILKKFVKNLKLIKFVS